MKKISFLLFLYSFILGRASGFDYKTVPASLVAAYTASQNQAVPAAAYPLEKALPPGYDRTGRKDYTSYIQQALNKNRVVVFPAFPLLINRNGLKVSSNSKLYFRKGALLRFAGPAIEKHNDILKVSGVENVGIYDARIDGSRKAGGAQSGEWSAGIAVCDSRNITILNAVIKDTWGDGIFIGSESIQGPVKSENVVVKGGWIDNARRNGISVTSVRGARIENMLVSNVNGTSPQCGIDIEPSTSYDILEKLIVKNSATFNCANYSFAVNLSALGQSGGKSKMVSISLSGLKDQGSSGFMGFSINPGKYNASPSGTITITDCTGTDNGSSIWNDPSAHKVTVKMSNVRSRLKNSSQLKVLQY